MPVSIVVGGQFGSEGKGKVALEIARRSSEPVTVVRVGGPNSGHTAYGRAGRKHVLRQLPVGCIDRDVPWFVGAGRNVVAKRHEIGAKRLAGILKRDVERCQDFRYRLVAGYR